MGASSAGGPGMPACSTWARRQGAGPKYPMGPCEPGAPHEVGMPWALRGAYSCLRNQHPARVACGAQALKSMWFSGGLSTTCLAARMAFIHMDGAWR